MPSSNQGMLVYRRLLGYALPYWKLFLVATLSMVVYAATDTGFAALMQPMLDHTFVEKDPNIIRLIPIAMVALFLVRGITGFLSVYGMTWVGRKIIQVMRSDIFRHLLGMPTAFFDRTPSGQLVSLLTYNVEQVSRAATNAITTIIRDTLTVAFLLGWMMFISGRLALFFLFLGPIIAVLVRYISKRFRQISMRIQRSMGSVTQIAADVIEGQKVVKTFGAQAYETKNFERINERNRYLHMKMAATSAASVPVVQFIAACTLAGIIYFATLEPVLETLSVGSYVSFITAMLLLLPPLKRLTTVTSSLQKGIAAADSIFALLDSDTESDKGTRVLQAARGEIEYRNVKFSYRPAGAQVLKGISFAARRGEIVAIVGRSGTGKSTLVNLAPRFYDPNGGTILVDGHDVQEYTLASLRDQIAMVGQETILFNDTVANNIAYGRLEQSSEADIRKAAIAAHAMEFIEQLPDGMNTLVGENGMLLSGGQRQRIAIARAILKNAPILILDEATSSLDSESEHMIQAALETLMRDRTTLVIAHRLSTVKNADRILVLDEGRVVESGRHEALLGKDGYYAGLYRTQFHDVKTA